ncbi:phosphotriesterase family protein [Dactylosporangium sp. CA-092794]|uniref:phosphotriesterase family protein n=1 Tax=Dactylosporangium sp. CA-092794 TaxID=3239929 RepID=UPI003D916E06
MDLPTSPPAAEGLVRTVLGDRPAGELGPCDYHEHLFQVSPLLPGDELDDEAAGRAEAARLHAAGIGSMIEATPCGLGRDPAAVARVSAATGLAIVHVSGAHRQEHYPAGHPLLSCDEATLTARFAADVRDGLPPGEPAAALPAPGPPALGPRGEPVRAGMLKAGVGYWRISPFERRVLAAVGAAAGQGGVAVMVHLEHGSAAWEVLARLAEAGLAADRVVLAHADRNLDAGLHAELAAAGAYLGYDGMARHREAPDSAILDCLAAVAAAGGADRLLLGGDVARRSRYVAYGGMPGLDYLPRRFVPRVRARLGDAVTDRILVANPARLLTLR